MMLTITGKGEEVVIQAAGMIGAATRAFLALAKKLEWEANQIEAETPVTDAEVAMSIELRQRELLLRERQISINELESQVKQDELEARKLKASVEHSEALMRQKALLLRSHGMDRAMNKAAPYVKKKNPVSVERPRQFPPMSEVEAKAVSTPAQPVAPERSSNIKTQEGQHRQEKDPLTHPLGEKLRAVTIDQ